MAGELIARVRELLGETVLDSHDHRGDATVLVERDAIEGVLTRLRDEPDLRFNFLMDLTAVDYLGREPRFEVVYHLAAVDVEPHGTEPSRLPRRLRVKVGVPEDDCELASAVDVWVAANWMEREVWDLYGIRFRGHPDLKRILLYEEFEGHPLRKDYPKERRQPLLGPRN
jgi:NADH-quinone oxidoreductase subunit C